jgi:hypothetical protein
MSFQEYQEYYYGFGFNAHSQLIPEAHPDYSITIDSLIKLPVEVTVKEAKWNRDKEITTNTANKCSNNNSNYNNISSNKNIANVLQPSFTWDGTWFFASRVGHVDKFKNNEENGSVTINSPVSLSYCLNFVGVCNLNAIKDPSCVKNFKEFSISNFCIFDSHFDITDILNCCQKKERDLKYCTEKIKSFHRCILLNFEHCANVIYLFIKVANVLKNSTVGTNKICKFCKLHKENSFQISTFGKFKFSEPITSIASKDKETILILLKSGKVFKLYLENSNGKKEYSQLSTSEDSGTRIYLDICCELCKYKEKNGLEKNIFTQVYFKQLHFALSSTLTYLPPPCITKIRCGLLHGVCLDDQGRLWSFGANNFGQLGRGLPINTEFEEEPKVCFHCIFMFHFV